jgi:hypothetical protein
LLEKGDLVAHVEYNAIETLEKTNGQRGKENENGNGEDWGMDESEKNRESNVYCTERRYNSD